MIIQNLDDLDAITTLSDSDTMLIEDSDSAKKVTIQQLKSGLSPEITTLNTATTAADTDYMLLRDTTSNKKISIANLKNIFQTIFTYVTAGQKSGTTLGNKATAEGENNEASGDCSHAEGSSCHATSYSSHAEGNTTTASQHNSHAEGFSTNASNYNSHAEGNITIASGINSHAEGYNTKASGTSSHAEGNNTAASGSSSHAEGDGLVEYDPNANLTPDEDGLIRGGWVLASGIGAHAEGTAYYNTSSETYTALIASEKASHAEGVGSQSTNIGSHSEGETTLASGRSSHAEGGFTKATGNSSHAEGGITLASGAYSHAEGESTEATGTNSHSEGRSTKAIGTNSHAGGLSCISSGDQSFSGGDTSKATANNSFAFGKSCEANGIGSISLGSGCKAENQYSLAAGYNCTTNGYNSISLGNGNTSSGQSSFTVGWSNNAYGTGDACMGYLNKTGITVEDDPRGSSGGDYSCAIGYNNVARQGGIALGYRNTARDGYAIGSLCNASHYSVAAGSNCIANDDDDSVLFGGAIALGYHTKSTYSYQTSVGRYNSPISGRYFIVGKGSGENVRSNAFSVDKSGSVYGASSYNSSGADYAEMFEWKDGNTNAEDRVGKFVTLDGNKIVLATSSDDYILGVVSGMPSVCGDVNDDQWGKMYLYDIYGRPVYGDVEMPELKDDDGNIIIEKHTEIGMLINPDYDPSQTYIPRSDRPEWDAVGLLGKLVCIDDGTGEVNGYVKVNDDSIATKSTERTKYRVMERLDENHIRIMIL